MIDSCVPVYTCAGAIAGGVPAAYQGAGADATDAAGGCRPSVLTGLHVSHALPLLHIDGPARTHDSHTRCRMALQCVLQDSDSLYGKQRLDRLSSSVEWFTCQMLQHLWC